VHLYFSHLTSTCWRLKSYLSPQIQILIVVFWRCINWLCIPVMVWYQQQAQNTKQIMGERKKTEGKGQKGKQNEQKTKKNKYWQTWLVQRRREMHAHVLAVVESWQIYIDMKSTSCSSSRSRDRVWRQAASLSFLPPLSSSFICRPSP